MTEQELQFADEMVYLIMNDDESSWDRLAERAGDVINLTAAESKELRRRVDVDTYIKDEIGKYQSVINGNDTRAEATKRILWNALKSHVAALNL
jgi:hypothetical protein